jgi:hypothetical protein
MAIPITQGEDVIDLTDPALLNALMEERHARRFSDEQVVAWLRSSGGSLTDRLMKQLAADAIERAQQR